MLLVDYQSLYYPILYCREFIYMLTPHHRENEIKNKTQEKIEIIRLPMRHKDTVLKSDKEGNFLNFWTVHKYFQYFL